MRSWVVLMLNSPNEKDRDTGIVLRALEVEILVHIIDFSVNYRVPV